jgi:hypothetical protein
MRIKYCSELNLAPVSRNVEIPRSLRTCHGCVGSSGPSEGKPSAVLLVGALRVGCIVQNNRRVSNRRVANRSRNRDRRGAESADGQMRYHTGSPPNVLAMGSGNMSGLRGLQRIRVASTWFPFNMASSVRGCRCAYAGCLFAGALRGVISG